MLCTSREKGEKGDVTGKGLAQLAHSAMLKWFRFFPPERETYSMEAGGDEGGGQGGDFL